MIDPMTNNISHATIKIEQDIKRKISYTPTKIKIVRAVYFSPHIYTCCTHGSHMDMGEIDQTVLYSDTSESSTMLTYT